MSRDEQNARQLTTRITTAVGNDLVALYLNHGHEMNNINLATFWNQLAKQRNVSQQHPEAIEKLLQQTLVATQSPCPAQVYANIAHGVARGNTRGPLVDQLFGQLAGSVLERLHEYNPQNLANTVQCQPSNGAPVPHERAGAEN